MAGSDVVEVVDVDVDVVVVNDGQLQSAVVVVVLVDDVLVVDGGVDEQSSLTSSH